MPTASELCVRHFMFSGSFATNCGNAIQKLLFPCAQLRQAGIEMTIAIIGLGYVGLPLALQFARSGVTVLGLDMNGKKVASLNAGRSYIKHMPADEIKKFVQAGKFSAST